MALSRKEKRSGKARGGLAPWQAPSATLADAAPEFFRGRSALKVWLEYSSQTHKRGGEERAEKARIKAVLAQPPAKPAPPPAPAPIRGLNGEEVVRDSLNADWYDYLAG